ncbi:MAG: AraC family transcriptional regulator [Cyanobacteria bacterium P01_F01_bin.53]
MKIKIPHSNYPQLIAEFRQKDWVSLYENDFGVQTDWHTPFMVGRSCLFDLSPDLKIYDWQQTLLEDLEIADCGEALPPVSLIFLLQGQLQCAYRDASYVQHICVESGQNLLLFTGLGKQGVWTCPRALQNTTIEVAIDAGRLLGYLGSDPVPSLSMLWQLLSQQSDQPYFHTGITTPAMQMVIHQYAHCPYEGAMQRMYLESKAVELVALKLSQIQQMAQASETKNSIHSAQRSSFGGTMPSLNSGDFSAKSFNAKNLKSKGLKSKDLERVHQAREILIEDITNPPSLQQLAEQVGIGDYKLKRDFRQTFGTTVFGYLRTHRLECARQLLAVRQMNVSEAAEFVGYSSLSKFTAAFKRQFGILPSVCSGQRKKAFEKRP